MRKRGKLRRVIAIGIACLMALSILAACGSDQSKTEKEEESALSISSLDDLAGHKVGTLQGSDYLEDMIRQALPDSELSFCDTVYELSESLSSGKIDAYVAHGSINKVKNYPELCVLTDLGNSDCASIFPKSKEGAALRDQFNQYLAAAKSDKSLKKLKKTWLESDETATAPDLASLKPTNGTLKMAVCKGVGSPFAYVKNDQFSGYEIALARGFCAEYGYGLQLVNYSFEDMLEAVQSGQADLGASCITISDDRKKKMYFSDVTSSSSVQLVVRTADANVDSVSALTSENEDTDIAKRFADKKVAVMAGTILSDVAAEYLPDSELCFYNTSTDMAVALQNNEVDAYVEDKPIAEANIQENEGQYIVSRLEDADHVFLFQKESEKGKKLTEQMNQFLAEVKSSGELKEMNKIWFGSDEKKKVIDTSTLTGENGTLKFAVSTDEGGAFVYLQDGEYLGYEADLAVRFCKKYGYGIKFVDSNYSKMLASVEGGRCDFAGSAITSTKERRERFSCSDANYNSATVLVAREHSESDKPVLSDSSLLKAIDGYHFGVLTGAIHDKMVEEKFPKSTYATYNSVADLATALDTGKIDGYFVDQPLGRILTKKYKDQCIYAVVELENVADIFPQNSVKSDELRAQFNQYLAQIKEDGTFKEINDIWFGDDESLKVVAYDSLTGENGTIQVATTTMVGEPFCYMKEGELVGYDLDLMVRFCKEYGYNVKFTDYDFGGMLAAVTAGKADVAAGCITVTEERKESMNFSDPTYYSGAVIVTKKNAQVKSTDSQSAVGKYLRAIKENFSKTFIMEGRWKLFAQGILTTLAITLLSALFGTILGSLIYLIYRKEKKPFNCFIDICNAILNKTPMVVILMILYYVVFGDTEMSSVWVSVIGFTLLFAGAVTSITSVSVQAVDPGQREAALALGYTETAAYIKVILPQAREQFLKLYQGELVALIKGTAVVGYIAAQDLTKVSDIIRSRTFEAFFPLVSSAIIYFAIAWLLAFLVERIRISSNPKRRNKKKILKGVDTK